MELSPAFKMLNITDFAHNDALLNILMKTTQLRPNYWSKIFSDAKYDCLIVKFASCKDQISVLKEITKIINKGCVPCDELLNRIPVFEIMYDYLRLKVGVNDIEYAEFKLKFEEDKKKRQYPRNILLLFS